MTAKELAEMLSGREYGREIGRGEEQEAKAAGLVVVYGCSDDSVELRGAIDREVGAWEGAAIHITSDGLLEEPACSDAENCTCPYFAAAKRAAKTIRAVWHNKGGPCWTFETDIPHETFTIVEDGEPWCIGIVFSMECLGNCTHKEGVEHSRWILDSSDEYASHYHCGKCGEEIDLCSEIYTESTPNYCPNCGAKMDGGGEK